MNEHVFKKLNPNKNEYTRCEFENGKWDVVKEEVLTDDEEYYYDDFGNDHTFTDILSVDVRSDSLFVRAYSGKMTKTGEPGFRGFYVANKKQIEIIMNYVMSMYKED